MGLLENIASGKYDDHLDRIIVAVNKRKTGRIYRLDVGDRVRFADNVRPEYLRGQTATIVEWRRTRVLIELDTGPLNRFRTGRIIAYPASLIPVGNTELQEG